MNSIPVICTFLFSAAAGWIAVADLSPNSAAGQAEISGQPTRRPNQTRTHDPVKTALQQISKLDSRESKIRSVIKLAHSIPADQLSHWLLNSSRILKDKRLWVLFSELATERLLAQDPHEFLEMKKSPEGENSSWDLAKCAAKHPNLALDFFRQAEGSKKPGAQNSFLIKLLELNPSKGFDLAIHALDREDLNSEMLFSLGNLMGAMVKHDLNRTLEFHQNLTSEMKAAAMPGIAKAMLTTHFPGGIELLKRHREINDTSGGDLLHRIFSTGQGHQLEEHLIQNADIIPEGWLHDLLTHRNRGALFGNLSPWLESNPGNLGLSTEVLDSMIEAGLKSARTNNLKPNTAMRIINGHRFGLEARKSLLEKEIRWWSEYDPGGLQSWVKNLQDEELFETADQALSRRKLGE